MQIKLRRKWEKSIITGTFSSLFSLYFYVNIWENLCKLFIGYSNFREHSLYSHYLYVWSSSGKEKLDACPHPEGLILFIVTDKPIFLRRCGNDSRTVYLKEGHWGEVMDGRLAACFCPSNYCKCVRNRDLPGCVFNPDRIDDQCAHNRTGVLCGQCQQGLSVGLRSV